MSKRLSKLVLVILIVLGAMAMWIPHQRSLAEARAALADAQAQRLKFEERIEAVTAELDSARSELHAQNTSRTQTRSAIEQTESRLSGVDPETRWVAPPVNLPDWNDESPYVWLRKDDLPTFPIAAFTESGALNEDIAALLTLEEKQKSALNSALTNILAEYRAVEAAKAERTDDDLPGISGQAGEKFTIRVQPQPEEGKRIKQQFEAALRNEIGAQRADILLQTSEQWLDQQFSQFGAEPKTISLLRHPDGSYSISIKSGASNWFSTGGPWRMVQGHIPPHLRSLFGEIAPRP